MGLPTVTGFIKSDLRLSASTAGLAVSSYLLGKLLGSYGAGLAADHFGESRVLVTGAMLTAAMYLVAMTVPFPWLFVLLGIAGLTGSGSTPAGGSLIRNAFPPRKRGMALGLRQTGIPVGGLIAATLLPWMAHAYGWRWSIATAAVVSAVAAVPMLLYAGARRVGGRATLHVPRRIAITRDVCLLTVWGTTAVMGQFGLLVFLPLDLHQRKHLSLTAAAMFVAVIQASGIVGRLGWGWVSDRTVTYGRKPLLIALTVGGVVASLLLFGVTSSTPIGLWALATVVAGLTLVGFQGLWVTMLTEASLDNAIGAATGFAVTFTLLGGALAAPLLGAVADAAGTYRAVWALLAVVLFASLAPALALGGPVNVSPDAI
jgi:sugar phosphate permease